MYAAAGGYWSAGDSNQAQSRIVYADDVDAGGDWSAGVSYQAPTHIVYTADVAAVGDREVGELDKLHIVLC